MIETTLYAGWKAVARQHRGELALLDLSDGRRWTFAQLEAEGETRPADERVIFPSGAGAGFVFDVLRAWRAGRVVCPVDRGDVAPEFGALPPGWVHVKTSSGSAGAPQLIGFTGEQLAADARNIVVGMGLRPDWPNLGVISLAHSYGFSNLVSPLLLHGVPLVLLPSRLPEVVRRACLNFSSLTLPAVPALWRVWHEAGGIAPSVKLAISAGAPLALALEAAIFKRTGLKVHNFYGASECGGICYDATERPRAHEQEVGTAMPNVKLDTDSDGCLMVSSDAAGTGYWPNPLASLGGGRFQTGDRAEILEGRVFLRGRRGDVINLAGRKIAPESIEQAILRHGGVRDCVVFGVPEPDGARGEAIAACVCAGEEVEQAALKRFVGDALPDWQVPRHWWFVADLTEGERGKISRAKWRERFLAERGTSGA